MAPLDTGSFDRGLGKTVDWRLVGCYLVLVLIGWLNIYASIHSAEPGSIFSWSVRSGKQAIWIATAIVLDIIILFVVIINTIKLAVFSRRQEISIMRYVGATNWFIRGPFLVEGIIIGMISAAIAAGIVFIVYSNVVDVIGMRVMTILSSPLVPPEYLMRNLLIIFIALGVGIGSTGSIISMRKFLEA